MLAPLGGQDSSSTSASPKNLALSYRQVNRSSFSSVFLSEEKEAGGGAMKVISSTAEGKGVNKLKTVTNISLLPK